MSATTTTRCGNYSCNYNVQTFQQVHVPNMRMIDGHIYPMVNMHMNFKHNNHGVNSNISLIGNNSNNVNNWNDLIFQSQLVNGNKTGIHDQNKTIQREMSEMIQGHYETLKLIQQLLNNQS